MKINIYNPTNQKPHVFSSWRVLFRVCACVHLSVHMKTIHGACAMERPMRSKAGGGWLCGVAHVPWDDIARVGSQPSCGLDRTLASFLTS